MSHRSSRFIDIIRRKGLTKIAAFSSFQVVIEERNTRWEAMMPWFRRAVVLNRLMTSIRDLWLDVSPPDKEKNGSQRSDSSDYWAIRGNETWISSNWLSDATSTRQTRCRWMLEFLNLIIVVTETLVWADKYSKGTLNNWLTRALPWAFESIKMRSKNLRSARRIELLCLVFHRLSSFLAPNRFCRC
jgi:hypothetical protein